MLNLDLSKEMTGGHIVHGRVGDNNSHIEKVSVINSDGTPFNLTGIAISFMGNTHEYQTKVIDSDGVKIVDAAKGLFQYTFPSMAFGVAGPYERAYFQFTNKDGVITSTGDFEVIVLDNTDITSNEAETIITEYNKLVAELNKLQKEEIAELTRLQNEAIDEMDQNFAVAQERIVELENQISDLRSQIEQALADFETGNFWTKEESFNKEQSSANVIYQLIGKEEAEILITADFNGKVTGSVVENPNVIRFSTNSTLMPPLTGSEPGQVYYDRAMTKDGLTLNVGNTNSGFMSQIQPNWNLVEIVDRTIPELFETLGLTDDSEKIEFIKKSVSSLRNSVDGVGTGLRRNRLTLKLYDSSGLLEAEESVNVTSQIQELVRETTDRTTIQNRISDSGFVSGLIYTEASDGVAVSQASLDYTKLQIKLKVSANLLIKLMIAAYCGEKESGTWIQKEQSLGADEDMNDFNEIGTYTVSYNHRINQPANIGSQQGWLTVYQASSTSSVVSQEVIYPNAGASKGGARMFARNLLNKNTNLWGDWQEITKLFASQLEVNNGTSDDKMISPKTLADTIKFKEVFKEGIALSNVANEGTLVPHGDSVGGSLNHVNNRPYTVNSDGSFTFKRATNLLVTGGTKLVVGDTNPTDYLHVNAYVNNALNEFIALGATAATNGTLRLTWSAMGQRVISVNSGDVLSLKIGLRSGKQAFAVQLTSLKIEEV